MAKKDLFSDLCDFYEFMLGPLPRREEFKRTPQDTVTGEELSVFFLLPLSGSIMSEELGIDDVPLTFLHRYIWRTTVESELVQTYRSLWDGPFRFNPDEIDEGRFFTQVEIRVLKERDQMTPNLVHELTLNSWL